MSGFGKVFAGLYEGSMLGAGVHVFALWPYCISRSDAHGRVEVNPRLAAVILGCSIPEVEAALDYLLRPDPESRSKEEDGRRLVRVGQFAYRIVNYMKYRDIRDAESRREYQREWVKEKRTGRRPSTHVDSRHVSTKSTQAEAEAEAEAEAHGGNGGAPPPVPPPRKTARFVPPSVDEVRAEITRRSLPIDPEAFVAHYQANGWVQGRGKPVKDWRACLTTWTKNAPLFSPPGAGRGTHFSDRLTMAEWGKDRPDAKK